MTRRGKLCKERLTMELNGKVAVVTGSSSGIGLELCVLLCGKGAMVYGLSRRESVIDHAGFFWLETDVTQPARYRQVVRYHIQSV